MLRKPKGSGTITLNGYKLRGFGDVHKGGIRILEHRLVAQKALGRELKHPEEVHHWNENKLDNRSENLVICPDRSYHMLMHQRQRAYEATGHADWLRCSYCKTYDAPENMVFRPRGKDRPGKMQYNHSKCASKSARMRV